MQLPLRRPLAWQLLKQAEVGNELRMLLPSAQGRLLTRHDERRSRQVGRLLGGRCMLAVIHANEFIMHCVRDFSCSHRCSTAAVIRI